MADACEYEVQWVESQFFNPANFSLSISRDICAERMPHASLRYNQSERYLLTEHDDG